MVVEVPKKNSLITPLVITAAGLGIVQGLVWFVLSLVSILLYENEISPSSAADSTSIGRVIYDIYLNKELDYMEQVRTFQNINVIIGAKEFNYFIYFYLVFSFLLLVVSSVLLWATLREKSEYYTIRTGTWIINMIILSLLDLILLCLIAHDYDQLKNVYKDAAQADESATIILASIGIVMALAARGFVVWVINVIFIVILGKHLYDLETKGAQPDPSILDAYTTGARPPWDVSSSIYGDNKRPGYNNKSFRDDNDNPMITASSQSFTHLPLNDRNNYGNRDRGNQRGQKPYDNYGNQNNNGNWNKRSQSENGLYAMGAGNNSPVRPQSYADGPNPWGQPAPQRTAKIGRQGGQRSPPLNVNPPFIPDPDYSPPGSPRVRGVLRPKSNYAMY